jgi:hypothetical protein
MLDPHAELHFEASGPGRDFLKAFQGGTPGWADAPTSVDVYSVRKNTSADLLIEEFMLVANFMAARKLSAAWVLAREAGKGSGVGPGSTQAGPGATPGPEPVVGPDSSSAGVSGGESGGGGVGGGGGGGGGVAGAAASTGGGGGAGAGGGGGGPPNPAPLPVEFLLRRHPPPRADQLRTLQAFCNKRGMRFDATDGRDARL